MFAGVTEVRKWLGWEINEMIQIRKFRKGGLRKLEEITMLETQISHMLDEIKIYFMKK